MQHPCVLRHVIWQQFSPSPIVWYGWCPISISFRSINKVCVSAGHGTDLGRRQSWPKFVPCRCRKTIVEGVLGATHITATTRADYYFYAPDFIARCPIIGILRQTRNLCLVVSVVFVYGSRIYLVIRSAYRLCKLNYTFLIIMIGIM